MTNRIRGKKREEVINKWLKGVEDPNVEVKPTKQENRYIVKAKKEEPKNEDVEPKNEEKEEPKNEDVEPKNEPKEPEREPKKEEPEYEYEYVYEEEEAPDSTTRSEHVNLNLQLQILNELRAMNEEKRLRREQKQRDKQIKEQVQKQLYKQRNKNYFIGTSSDRSESNAEPPPQNRVQIGERRRLNLLRKYY